MPTVLSVDLEEDVTDTPVTKEIDSPEKEEADADDVIDQRMLRGELAPVLIYHLQSLLVHPVKVRGSWTFTEM